MSEGRAALERLCARYGIGAHYHDIWGKRHEVSESSLAALLGEFGVDASTPRQIERIEAEADSARWRAALDPVTAIAANVASFKIRIRVPQSAGSLRWRIEEEGGERHEGDADARRLTETGRGQIGGAGYRECELELRAELAAGYHRLQIADSGRTIGEAMLIAAPARCYRPGQLEDGARVWGPALQLYALRSERNWGIGDFTDLTRLVEDWAALGAGIFGLNPLHALFPHNPLHASPYSPSSRVQLNVLYLDVEAVEDFAECEDAQRRARSGEFQATLVRLREAPLVDYAGVAAAKFEVLGRLYAHFRDRHLGANDERAREFRAFQADGGSELRRHALFEALQEHFHAADPAVWGWPVWPEAYRDHDSEAVARFAAEHVERVEYYEYLQWQAERQLARVGERCAALGVAVGLYLDLAVSVDRAGSDAWTNREIYALGASVGAPPDEFNPNGQNWGLPPLRPDRLRASGYELFIHTLRESMRNAGALRIDHVMGLMRLFWIPPERTARDGAYVHYALDEMLAIVALESERNRCMVIGEDLGTVADEVREGLARIGVLSYRLLYFERERDGEFKPGAAYPAEALVAVSTHDLATLAGWWEGRDLRLRLDLGLFPNESVYETQLVGRAQERVRLMLALQHAGLLPPGIVIDPAVSVPLTPAIVEAVHAFVAAAPSRVLMVQLEDALGVTEQANMPGTTDEHPNWCRKIPESLERLAGNPRVTGLAGVLAKLRPHPLPQAGAAGRLAAKVPRATYRLQLHHEFTFADASRVVPYLARLGVSHVYCSPVLRARQGSLHGYDIVDHAEINPELGGREGFERFIATLREHDMGLLFDVVPNHMGVLGADNGWWMDVLENGPGSAYAQYFDIDWLPVNPDLAGKVLVPALGDHYGLVLERGEIALQFEPEAGAFAVRYHEHRFPVDPREYPALLRRADGSLALQSVPVEARQELSSLASAFGHLPARDAPSAEAVAERARDKEMLKRRLARLAQEQPEVARALESAVAAVNAASGDALHALLEAQAYRLAYWRVASDEINYRRFFDINELAALRMENEAVFEATHALVLALAAEGKVDGLRIDHPDGLFDPARYFERLQQGYARRAGIALGGAGPDARPPRPLYVVVEKITARHEHVPETWHVHGTTGYRFAAVVNGLFVDTAARGRFDRIWRSFSGEHDDFEELAYQGKRAIMRGALASELTVLATELLRIARADRRTRDYTFNTLRLALAEVAACMPVYRTYIAERSSAQDQRYVDWAVAHARRHSQAADTSIFSFVRQSLLAQTVDGAPPELAERVRRFAIRFQQFTSPVAAKGVEDTAFYLYNRLASLNEVGGDPDMFGMSVRAFHGASADRAARWPHTMLATSTHDNKRSEDVRCRIDVLSEMPGAWRLALRRWSEMNRPKKKKIEGASAPSRNDEYLLYQILLGTYPARGLDEAALGAYRERIEQYMLKAAREAKAHTSWISPNEEYEGALAAFVRALLGRVQPNPFLDDLRVQVETIEWFGSLTSLSLALVKFTSPGVPDLYQGNELVDLSLVDPDNRRPVDYALRARLLEESLAVPEQDLARTARTFAESPHDGRAKLHVTARLLELRQRNAQLFRDGGYKALTVVGQHAAHVVAYAREHGDQALIVIAGRLYSQLLGKPGRLPTGDDVWADTAVETAGLAEGARLVNVLSGESLEAPGGKIALARAFAAFPGAAFLVEKG